MDTKKIRIENIDKKNYILKGSEDIDIDIIKIQSLLMEGFMFGLCTQGFITIQIDSVKHDIAKNGLFVILPKHVFSFLSMSADAKFEILAVSFDIIHKLPVAPDLNMLRKTSIQPCISSDPQILKELNALYSILHHYTQEREDFRLIGETIINSIILIIASCFSNIGNEPDTILTRKEELSHSFFKLMFEHTSSEHGVRFYADKLCITPKYLSLAVKSVSGHSAQEWINETILTEAKRYLKTTNMSIFQIAEKLHFSNTSSFIRFFKKNTHTTPLEYRKN